MSRRDDTPPGGSLDPLDQLRHDLKTPLVTIHGRAQLVARSIQGSPSLHEEERVRMLAGITAIQTAVQILCAVIDAMGTDDVGGER